VVPAPIGAESLNVHHGRILLADNAQSFAEAVLLVLRDENLQCGHEPVAAELAKQYDWAVIGGKFRPALKIISGQFSAPEKVHASEVKFGGYGFYSTGSESS